MLSYVHTHYSSSHTHGIHIEHPVVSVSSDISHTRTHESPGCTDLHLNNPARCSRLKRTAAGLLGLRSPAGAAEGGGWGWGQCIHDNPGVLVDVVEVYCISALTWGNIFDP